MHHVLTRFVAADTIRNGNFVFLARQGKCVSIQDVYKVYTALNQCLPVLVNQTQVANPVTWAAELKNVKCNPHCI